MAEAKKQKSVKDKEILEKMIAISDLIEQGKESEEIQLGAINYYKDFVFQGTNLRLAGKNCELAESNIYIAKIENTKENTNTYEIYSGNTNTLIATVDERGKLHFMPEYIEKLKQIEPRILEMINLEGLDFELPKELGENDISLQKVEIEEARKSLSLKDNKTEQQGKSIEEIEKTTGVKDIEAYSEMKTDQVFDTVTNKQEINPNAKVTQTETLADMIPEIKQKGFTKIGVVYSDRTKAGNGRFSFIGITKQGEIEPIESLSNIEGTTTGQKVTSINSRDGSIIEQEQVAGMVKLDGRNTTNGNEEYLSVKIGQYGILEVDYVRRQLGRNKEDAYFSAPVETRSQMPTTREVKEMMDKHHNSSLEDELDRATPELQRDGETRIENIDEIASNDELGIDDIIVLEDGTQTTIRNEAEKAKISPQEFLQKYESKSGKTADEIIEQVHEEVEEEFRGNGERPRG